MNLQKTFIEEYKREMDMTRETLKRIPEDKLSWKPHEKSMTLGQLGLHIALIPGRLSELFSKLKREVPTVPLGEPESITQLLNALEESEIIAMKHLTIWNEEQLEADWSMVDGEQILMTEPRWVMIRSLMFNHLYHHRGQLTVYLRLLNISVPAIYGASADENG
ncbi:DinB family protein [Halalkalibacter sp. AB-rgal2]|uniref:DinB family protein n=1 Tax=Halalkalibacter sp. AB-rgal2 TaxID=3242695 RepID=UPI00359EF52B